MTEVNIALTERSHESPAAGDLTCSTLRLLQVPAEGAATKKSVSTLNLSYLVIEHEIMQILCEFNVNPDVHRAES